MASQTISQFPALPLTTVPGGAYAFVLPVDATISGTLATYKISLDEIRDFVLNGTQSYTALGSTDIIMASAGNVGIGNFAPAEKLDITGNVKASGSVTAPGGFVGNVDTATKLKTGRTFQLKTGDVTTASITFDGTGNVHLHSTIVPGAVVTSKIKDKNVTTGKIADDAVDTGQLANNAVRTAKILDANVTTAKIAPAAVITSKIADLNVTSGKIAAGAITNTKISSDQIDAGHLKDGIISSAKIVTGAVGTTKIADASITTAKIGAKQVSGSHLSDGAVGTAQIADAAITTAKILNGAVQAQKLQTLAGVEGQYFKNPKITVNNKGLITAIEDQSQSLMLSGGVLTGRLELKSGNEDVGGLFWTSMASNLDQASVTWEKSGSDRHTLRFAVTGADPADQSGIAGYGNDDRILFEVPNLSGVSIKVDGTEYPIWHKGHVPDVVAEIQNYYDTHAFTHFIAENDSGTAQAAADGSTTLTLLGSHINTALGYTAAPNTRAHIVNTLGFEPVARTGRDELISASLTVAGKIHVKGYGSKFEDELYIGSDSNGIYINPNQATNSSSIRLNYGNNRIHLGGGTPALKGDNHLKIEASGSYLQLRSVGNSIYYDAINHQFRYKNQHPLGFFGLWNNNGHLEVGRGPGSHGFEGRLFVQSGEHNGLVIARHSSNVKLQAGVTGENVTFGTKGTGRALIKIESGAARRDGHPMITLDANNFLRFDAQAFSFRNSDNPGDKNMNINVLNNSGMGSVQFNTYVTGVQHKFLQVGGNNVQLGVRDNESLLFLQNAGTGIIGMGTTNPTAHATLTVQEKPGTTGSILCRSSNDRGLWLGHNWTHRGSNYGAIHNDTSGYKTLMIVGNSTAGYGRKVSLWDRVTIGSANVLSYGDSRLSVHGSARISGSLKIDGNIHAGKFIESHPTDFTVVTFGASYNYQNVKVSNFYNNWNYGVYVNGQWASERKGRGINTAILKPDGSLRKSGTHDTYASVTQWEKHIEWIFDHAEPGDMVVCNMQDASTALDFHIRTRRNTRDQRGNSKASRHASGDSPKAVAFYTRMGGRGMFIKPRTGKPSNRQSIRSTGAWAFIMPSNYKDFQSGATDGYEGEKISRNRYYDGFNYCYIERFAESGDQGWLQLRTSYQGLMDMGGTPPQSTKAARAVAQKMSISVNHLQANSIVKKAPDMNDYCYPPSGDALVFDNIYAGYGNYPGNTTSNQQRGHEYFGVQEPYYWRDHTSSWNDWSYAYSNRRRNDWYERYMIRTGWNNQSNHYGGLRIRIPDGVDTLWVQKHDSWYHAQVYYLHPGGTVQPGYSNSNLPQWGPPAGSGRHPRYGYRKRSGKFGTFNSNYDRPYTPYDGIMRSHRQWLGDWCPIPLERKLLDEHPYVTLINNNTSSDPWMTGIAFGRNPWNHTYNTAINMHWRLNGGSYIWWSGHWWYRHWCYNHAWHNRTLYIPCIFNGKDKVLYGKFHSWGATGQGSKGHSIMVNDVPIGNFHHSFQNPFQMSGVGDYLGSTYKGLLIPADVIMKNHHDGAGSVSSASYKGDVGYIKVSMQGGYSDYSSYWTEMGTHDYAPDPYIVHTGLGNHDNINGPLAPTQTPYGDAHSYYPGGAQWRGY